MNRYRIAMTRQTKHVIVLTRLLNWTLIRRQYLIDNKITRLLSQMTTQLTKDGVSHKQSFVIRHYNLTKNPPENKSETNCHLWFKTIHMQLLQDIHGA